MTAATRVPLHHAKIIALILFLLCCTRQPCLGHPSLPEESLGQFVYYMLNWPEDEVSQHPFLGAIDPNLKDVYTSYSLLGMMLARNRFKIALKLLELGANPDDVCTPCGDCAVTLVFDTPLQMLPEEQAISLVRAVLQREGHKSLTLKNSFGLTPLHYVIFSPHRCKLARMLIKEFHIDASTENVLLFPDADIECAAQLQAAEGIHKNIWDSGHLLHALYKISSEEREAFAQTVTDHFASSSKKRKLTK